MRNIFAQIDRGKTGTIEKEKLITALSKRVKELKCLYSLADLVERPGISLEGILQGIAELIPSAWRYPKNTCARIIFEGREFKTNNFRKTQWKQQANIKVHGKIAGRIEVYCLEERPGRIKDSFLKEEKTLLGALAERAGEITERKEMEEALLHAAEEWRTTFDSISDMVSLNDKNYRIIRTNKAFADTFKMKPKDVVGKTCYKLIHGTKKPWPICPHEKALKTKKPARVEFLEPRLGVYLEVSASPVFDKRREATGSVHIIKDITERKKAEEKLRKAYEELRESQQELIQSEKLAAIGELAAGAAHEINNPLFAISGEAEMLSKDEKKDRDTKDTSKIILEQCERIKNTVEKLLEFSRKREFKAAPLDINKVLEKSLSLLKYQARIENVEIIRKLNRRPLKTLGDESQLEQAFLNIMLNAVQAIEKGGKLTVSSVRPEGEKIALVEFKDTGKGMDEETLKKIFNPFFSTKTQGTGLGLSITHRIIEDHSGSVEAHSILGEGSTFTVKLPIFEKGKK